MGVGAAVEVAGDLIPSQGKGQRWELKAARLEIVGEDEADPSRGLINVASPLARALIGKTVDDEAVLKTSQATKTYTILKIEFV